MYKYGLGMIIDDLMTWEGIQFKVEKALIKKDIFNLLTHRPTQCFLYLSGRPASFVAQLLQY